MTRAEQILKDLAKQILLNKKLEACDAFFFDICDTLHDVLKGEYYTSEMWEQLNKEVDDTIKEMEGE